MDDHTLTLVSDQKRRSCIDRLMLCELEEGQPDKLGHKVEQILWLGKDYAIYRTHPGVYVQFSDNEQEASEQRQRFIKICPELCELRYLTPQMRSWVLFGRRKATLYDHNIAQAIMLVIEGDVETGRKIAQQALKMAVERVANDNTIKYVCASLAGWFLIIALGVALFLLGPPSSDLRPYVVAGIAGATGAILSIATRLQSFRLKPCDQSNMNYLMSLIRVGIVGAIAGVVLWLIAPTLLHQSMQQLQSDWQAPASVGLIAGFAERLIPNIMRWSSVQLEPSFGTPSQAVRAEEMRTSKQAGSLPNTETHDVEAKGKSQALHKVTEPA
jgi:hypothetical protein